MRSYRSTLSSIIVAGLCSGSVMMGQTITTGAISGRVVDVGGAPVVGASVRATSGQITRTVVTNPEGHFMLSLLNGGSWTLQVAKAGYSTSTQTVQVAVNTTTTSNFKVAKEGAVTVEVVATSSTIDTASTSTGSNFALDEIQAIPKGRDITDLAFMTPGVVTSGFGSGQGLNLSMAGASGAENSFSIDGLSTNDMRYGGSGVNLVTEFVDQVDIQTGGFKPEYSALGGVFNVVTKSGSNEFSGTAWATATPSSLKPKAKTSEFYTEPAPTSRYDAGFWAGGAVVKDVLFYSVGLNYDRLESPGASNNSGLPIGSKTQNTYQLFSKFNYYLNPSNQLTLSYFGTPQTSKQKDGNTLLSVGFGNGTANGAATEKNRTSNISLIWDSVINSTMNFSVKVGQGGIKNNVDPNNAVDPLVHDSLMLPNSEYYSSGGYGLVINEENKTKQGSFDFNWVVGNHGLKFGVSIMSSEYSLEEHYSGGARYVVDLRDGIPRLRERVIYNDATVKAEYDAIYAQDTWQVTPALNIFYGARMERQVQKGANGQSFMTFNFLDYVQPRLGFTWDVLGNTRSKLSGSYAKYYEKIPQRMAIRQFGGEVFYENRYGGGYLGNTFSYDPTNANGYGTYSGTPTVVDYAASFSNPPIADGIKLPERNEYQLGYEQQVTDAIKVGVQARYRKLTNPIEDSVITDAEGAAYDPNEMAILWNPGKSVSWKASDGSGTISVADTLFSEAYNTYKAVDFTFEWKKGATYLKAIYTLSRSEGNYEGLVSGSNGQADANITASFDYYPYTGTGLLPLDRTHQIKVFGYHTFQVASNPLNLGFNWSFQSGTPISLWDDGRSSDPILPDIGDYGDSIPQNNKLGNKGRTPSHWNLDLSADYEFKVAGRFKVMPMVNITNVFNRREAATVNEQATDSGGSPFPEGYWGSPSSFYPGRTIRLGAKVRF